MLPGRHFFIVEVQPDAVQPQGGLAAGHGTAQAVHLTEHGAQVAFLPVPHKSPQHRVLVQYIRGIFHHIHQILHLPRRLLHGAQGGALGIIHSHVLGLCNHIHKKQRRGQHNEQQEGGNQFSFHGVPPHSWLDSTICRYSFGVSAAYFLNSLLK